MKFIDLQGRSHSCNINQYKKTYSKKSRSNYQKKLGEILLEIWPHVPIYEEMPCPGTGLRLDFFIPSLRIGIEMQGEQHDSYIPFFHKNKYGFARSQARDDSKSEWCRINDITLIKIYEKDLEKSIIRQIINESISR